METVLHTEQDCATCLARIESAIAAPTLTAIARHPGVVYGVVGQDSFRLNRVLEWHGFRRRLPLNPAGLRGTCVARPGGTAIHCSGQRPALVRIYLAALAIAGLLLIVFLLQRAVAYGGAPGALAALIAAGVAAGLAYLWRLDLPSRAESEFQLLVTFVAEVCAARPSPSKL